MTCRGHFFVFLLPYFFSVLPYDFTVLFALCPFTLEQIVEAALVFHLLICSLVEPNQRLLMFWLLFLQTVVVHVHPVCRGVCCAASPHLHSVKRSPAHLSAQLLHAVAQRISHTWYTIKPYYNTTVHSEKYRLLLSVVKLHRAALLLW